MVLPSIVTCFDISKMLAQYPAYSSFSSYLTQSQLAEEINTRQTITVLAVDNGGMGPISGKPMDVIKKVLSIHVILDYFDVQKLYDMANQTLTVATLLQASGQAQGMQGFINITDLTTGPVTFLSASDPNGTGTKLIESVVSQPYNISVVHVSTVIVPPALLSPPNAPVMPVPVPVVSPVVVPVPVVSPVPVVVPVPVVSPAPIATPVPVRSPVPVMAPVPVNSPMPVASPVPVAAPVAVPAGVPVPALSPPSPSPSLEGASDAPADSTSPSSDGSAPTASDGGGANSAGVAKFEVMNSALAIFLTFSSMYVLSTPTVPCILHFRD